MCDDASGANAVFTALRAASHGKVSYATDARDGVGFQLKWTSGAGSAVDACRNSGVGCWFIDDDSDEYAFPIYLISGVDEPPMGPDAYGSRGWSE